MDWLTERKPTMKSYQVTLFETVTHTIIVEADTESEAIDQASEMWQEELNEFAVESHGIGDSAPFVKEEA
jgi:hypothetical protein